MHKRARQKAQLNAAYMACKEYRHQSAVDVVREIRSVVNDYCLIL